MKGVPLFRRGSSPEKPLDLLLTLRLSAEEDEDVGPEGSSLSGVVDPRAGGTQGQALVDKEKGLPEIPSLGLFERELEEEGLLVRVAEAHGSDVGVVVPEEGEVEAEEGTPGEDQKEEEKECGNPKPPLEGPERQFGEEEGRQWGG